MESETLHGLLIIGGMILFFVGVIKACIFFEKRTWNNGACGECNKGFWRSFDMDSSGATGYNCTECGYTIWQSWYKGEKKSGKKTNKNTSIEG